MRSIEVISRGVAAVTLAWLVGTWPAPARADDRCAGAPAPSAFQVIQWAQADLDGDGAVECVTLALRPAGSPRSLEGDLVLEVARPGGRAPIVTVEMVGRPERFEIVRPRGSTRPLVVGAATHLDGPCAGMELHVLRVGPAGAERLLDLSGLRRGHLAIRRDGRLDVHTGDYRAGEEGDAPACAITTYELRGDRLVKVAEKRAGAGPRDARLSAIGPLAR